jgi:hypothetical protein
MKYINWGFFLDFTSFCIGWVDTDEEVFIYIIPCFGIILLKGK